MLAVQVYLKFTKFTRRSRQPRDLFPRVLKTYAFVRDMSRHNLEVVRRSKCCLGRLAERRIHEVSVYGERHIVEVLRELALDSPVKIKRIYGDTAGLVSLGESVKSREGVIIASLVDVERKRERLRKLGVEEQRIFVLI